MANNKQGFNALNQSLRSMLPPTPTNQEKYMPSFAARVTKIEEGESNTMISFQPIDKELGGTDAGIAYPISPNTDIPLIGETVLIRQLHQPNLGVIRSDTISYFFDKPIGLFHSPEHNADPRLNTDNTEQDFSGSFIERGNIRRLKPFVGDSIIQSRFGSSIRFGNTYQNEDNIPNNWSEIGEQGDPITILRNGQPDNSEGENWIPIVERIDEDKSSIYLTSTQQIPLTSATTNYSAVRQTPEVPNAYSSNQVILNSGRLVFNSNVDSILLSSQKTVTISANEDIGLTSEQNVALVGTEIKLGRADARESVILGDSFFDQFETLLSKLSSLASALEVLNDFPGGSPIPNLIVNSSAGDVKAEIATLRSRLPQLKSQITKTV